VLPATVTLIRVLLLRRDADPGFPLIRATVASAPRDAYAATQYRRH